MYLVVFPFGVLMDASSAFDHVLVHVRVCPEVEYGTLVVVVSLRVFVNTSPLLSYVKLVVRPGVVTVAGKWTHVESYAIVVVRAAPVPIASLIVVGRPCVLFT
jgi:hypothetical protein